MIENTLIWVGAVILHHVNIERNLIFGANSLILEGTEMFKDFFYWISSKNKDKINKIGYIKNQKMNVMKIMNGWINQSKGCLL